LIVIAWVEKVSALMTETSMAAWAERGSGEPFEAALAKVSDNKPLPQDCLT
jgi:hypothetical protein